MAKCKQCGKEYNAKRSTSAYCSPKCKQEFYRNRISVTSAEPVTVTAPKPVTIAGPKRGKDIKTFDELPPDVQATINRLSDSNEEKAKRTAAAIKYQHLFPESFEPKSISCTGVVTGKPGDQDYNGICTEAWRAARGR